MSLNKQENKSGTKGKIKPKHNISSVFYFFWEDAKFFFLSFCFQKDANQHLFLSSNDFQRWKRGT